MLIYVLAGVTAGEGILRISGHEYSPRIMKKVTQPTYEMLQKQYCVTLVSVTFFTSVLCKTVIPRAQLYLLNRKGIITKCIQTSLSIVGTCTFSTTFVLATVIYIARRDAALTFLKGLKRLYDLLKDLESFISESLSDPSRFVEKFSSEIAKELEEINEVAQAIIFHNEPEAIKDINQEISSFEEHLKILQSKMPEFEQKLEILLKKIQENQAKFLSELSLIEAQAKKLEEIFNEIEHHPLGFCDSILKEYIDYDKLKEKGDTFQELFKEGLSLNKKALLITTGLHLILETNALEDKGIDLWFSIVQATHLPMVQDIALFAVDIPIFIKELGRVYMHNQFRRDSFFNFKVKRIILCRKYPDDVAEFRDGLVHLRYARTSILDHLNQISALKTQVKENWSEESEQIRKGSRLLQKSSFSLQGKLQKERNERGLIRTFIV